ncbi:ABC transporter permease [Amylibacter marinus]|uniref:ABC transporter permease n=1 Tax=Amylibacter marinus TaxID=1475483 RepID=A0ABQ5VXY4_9RHOB|nr:ABC transporter ATP-binding protein [Amylibacter marinus]GLQ35953.1 ABC transporter permease [Amylibacter marinus]
MIFTRFLSLLWRHSPRKTALIFATTTLAGLTEGIGLLLLVPLLASLQSQSADSGGMAARVGQMVQQFGVPNTTKSIVMIFVGLVALRAIIDYLRSVVSQRIQLELMDDLRSQTFAALLGAQWKWLLGLRKSDHTSLLLNDIARISQGLSVSIQFLVNIVRLAIYLLVAAALSVPMTAVALLVGVIAALLLRKQHSRAGQLGRRLNNAHKVMQQIIDEGLGGIKLTKILGNEHRHRQVMEQIMQNLRDQRLAFTRVNARAGALFQVIIALFLAGFLIIGLDYLTLQMESLLILVLILARAAPMFRKLQSDINILLHAEPALDSLSQTLSQADQHQDTPDQGAEAPLALNHTIRLKNISFSYGHEGRYALRDITLDIPANKTTAIKGASGSGKSTLADMIMGLLTPDTGEITIDGQELTSANRRAWRQSIAYVPQDVFLFHDSIRNNLLWARMDADDDALEQALRKAAAEFVFDLPDGLDTVVGDGGIRLSGGERQRIALARAMLNAPKLLILDEATSALDLENELRIRDSIQTLHGDLTMIIIGHRLPTLENADQIITVDAGTATVG